MPEELITQTQTDARRGIAPNFVVAASALGSGITGPSHHIASRGTISDVKVAVLVPCYNEQATIARVIADFSSALPSTTFPK